MRDRVFLKVSPIEGIQKFEVQGMLSPRYIKLYEIIEKVNPIAYKLNLPVELKHIHNMFYISQLKKYIPHPDHFIITESIEVTKHLLYEECLVQIPDRRIK